MRRRGGGAGAQRIAAAALGLLPDQSPAGSSARRPALFQTHSRHSSTAGSTAILHSPPRLVVVGAHVGQRRRVAAHQLRHVRRLPALLLRQLCGGLDGRSRMRAAGLGQLGSEGRHCAAGVAAPEADRQRQPPASSALRATCTAAHPPRSTPRRPPPAPAAAPRTWPAPRAPGPRTRRAAGSPAWRFPAWRGHGGWVCAGACEGSETHMLVACPLGFPTSQQQAEPSSAPLHPATHLNWRSSSSPDASCSRTCCFSRRLSSHSCASWAACAPA